MTKKSKVNIPSRPDSVDFVRSFLIECGVSKWKETIVSEQRVDFSFLATNDQQSRIINSIPHDIFALKGLML